ncbi:MAG: type II toxin-antitoxin system VapC family toxin [Actinobacteria bacterium]|nr:type II toxin-antitoxin system VapC family toxin [Actinomycetota bacterium]
MTLLLDTHVVLWWMAGEPERIGKRAKQAIGDGKDELLISAVVIWEVAIKRRLGKLDAPADLLVRLEQAGVDLLPITAHHADRVATLPMHHQDPFDRLLVAQADIDGLTLLSGDGAMRRYEVAVLW